MPALSINVPFDVFEKLMAKRDFSAQKIGPTQRLKTMTRGRADQVIAAYGYDEARRLLREYEAIRASRKEFSMSSYVSNLLRYSLEHAPSELFKHPVAVVPDAPLMALLNWSELPPAEKTATAKQARVRPSKARKSKRRKPSAASAPQAQTTTQG